MIVDLEIAGFASFEISSIVGTVAYHHHLTGFLELPRLLPLPGLELLLLDGLHPSQRLLRVIPPPLHICLHHPVSHLLLRLPLWKTGELLSCKIENCYKVKEPRYETPKILGLKTDYLFE